MYRCEPPKTPPGKSSSAFLRIPRTPRYAPIDEPDAYLPYSYRHQLDDSTSYLSKRFTPSTPTSSARKTARFNGDLDQKPGYFQTPKTSILKRDKIISASHLMFPLTPDQTPVPKKRRTFNRFQRLTSDIASSDSTSALFSKPSHGYDPHSSLPSYNETKKASHSSISVESTADTLAHSRARYFMRSRHDHFQTSLVADSSPAQSTNSTKHHEHISTPNSFFEPSRKRFKPSSSRALNTPSDTLSDPYPKASPTHHNYSSTLPRPLPKRFIDIDTFFLSSSSRKRRYNGYEDDENKDHFSVKSDEQVQTQKHNYNDSIPNDLLENVDDNNATYPRSSQQNSTDNQQIAGMWCVFRGKKVFRPFPQDDHQSWLNYKPKVLFPKSDSNLKEDSGFKRTDSPTKTHKSYFDMFPELTRSEDPENVISNRLNYKEDRYQGNSKYNSRHETTSDKHFRCPSDLSRDRDSIFPSLGTVRTPRKLRQRFEQTLEKSLEQRTHNLHLTSLSSPPKSRFPSHSNYESEDRPTPSRSDQFTSPNRISLNHSTKDPDVYNNISPTRKRHLNTSLLSSPSSRSSPQSALRGTHSRFGSRYAEETQARSDNSDYTESRSSRDTLLQNTPFLSSPSFVHTSPSRRVKHSVFSSLNHGGSVTKASTPSPSKSLSSAVPNQHTSPEPRRNANMFFYR